MHKLIVTDNHEKIKQIAKEYANKNDMAFFPTTNTKEDMDKIKIIFEEFDNMVVFIKGLNKSPISDSLLKLLEDCPKNIVVFATTDTYDVKEALASRFIIDYYNNKDIEDEVDAFLHKKKVSKEAYSTISFYISLARKTYDNIHLVNTIISDIRKCTYNTPWDYYYFRLRKEWK